MQTGRRRETLRCNVGMKNLFFLCLSLAGGLSAYSQPLRIPPRTQGQETEISSIGKPADRTAGMPTGIARINGILYYVTNNQATLATAPFRIAELRLEENGTLILSDGRRINLIEGQMVTVAGTIVDAPRGVELPEPIRAPSESRRLARRPVSQKEPAKRGIPAARTPRSER